MPRLFIALLLAALPSSAPAAAPVQTEADEYTRYELLAPATNKFRIAYEVTATTAGARFYFNPIRKGSAASDEAVYDRMDGQKLPFEVVGGAAARAGGVAEAVDDEQYIKVILPRPVPQDGQVRLLIDKTYADAKSYRQEGDRIVFERSLSIRRNSVVLPQGYELVACSFPSQMAVEADGRVRVSFMNTGPDAVSYKVTAAKARTKAAPAAGAAPAGEVARRTEERAHQDRDIVYFLNPPETHSFDLYHDYTEARAGIDKYLNVVRAGSKASQPSARILDTGEMLKVETLRGAAITAAKLDLGEDGPVKADTEVVVIRFPAVTKGRSLRLRISETYTDPKSYRIEGDGFVFDRALGRPRNAVVLPKDYVLTGSSVPAVVSETADGRIRLDLHNARTDEIAVLITGRKAGIP
jgi:hypothetical protein